MHAWITESHDSKVLGLDNVEEAIIEKPMFSEVIDWTRMPDCIEPIPTQINQGRSKLRLARDFSKGVDNKKCSSDCSCLEPSGTICMTEGETVLPESAPEEKRKPEQAYEELITHPDFLDDPPRPPPKHRTAMLDEVIQRKDAQRQASPFPGCGPDCGHGTWHPQPEDLQGK